MNGGVSGTAGRNHVSMLNRGVSTPRYMQMYVWITIMRNFLLSKLLSKCCMPQSDWLENAVLYERNKVFPVALLSSSYWLCFFVYFASVFALYYEAELEAELPELLQMRQLLDPLGHLRSDKQTRNVLTTLQPGQWKAAGQWAPDLHRHPIWCLLTHRWMVTCSLCSAMCVCGCTGWKTIADTDNYKPLLATTACYMVSDSETVQIRAPIISARSIMRSQIAILVYTSSTRVSSIALTCH